MWGSGYPHTDGVWPESAKYIEEQSTTDLIWIKQPQTRSRYPRSHQNGVPDDSMQAPSC